MKGGRSLNLKKLKVIQQWDRKTYGVSKRVIVNLAPINKLKSIRLKHMILSTIAKPKCRLKRRMSQFSTYEISEVSVE